MSRIGKKIIEMPNGVTAALSGRKAVITGARGEFSFDLPQGINLELEENKISVKRENETKIVKSLHGAVQSILENAVRGVSDGWVKKMELIGTGYRARIEGNDLILALGFSHPVIFSPPEGITFSMEDSKVVVSGINRHVVGQVAANIRAVRAPEPYKGKGVKYEGEFIRRKAGKAAKAGA